MTVAKIARLKITLNHVKPMVLRRIEVPLDIRLGGPWGYSELREALKDPKHEQTTTRPNG
jgi:hypothetical protein